MKNITVEAVKVVAKEEGVTEIELISTLQAVAAQQGDEKTLEKLIAVKNVFIQELMK